MKELVKASHYIRRSRPEKAVIYVRGDNEALQELKCREYANNKGYEVAYVTRYIEDVKQCDVLLVANFSRISRKQMEFVKAYKLFKARGIRIENSAGHKAGYDNIYKTLESFKNKY